MATKKLVREDRFTPLAVGLTIALVIVGVVIAAGADPSDPPDPILPAALLAANGLLLIVRPAAYFIFTAPRWYFKNGERGEPSAGWLWVSRLSGVVVIALAVVAVVASRHDPGRTCELTVLNDNGGYSVEECPVGETTTTID